MSGKDVVGIVIVAALAAVLVGLSIYMMLGKGAKLIAGYNTSPKRDEYDGVGLSKFVGKILLPCGLLMPLVVIGGIYQVHWMPAVYVVMVIALCTFALIYANTGGRFRK